MIEFCINRLPKTKTLNKNKYCKLARILKTAPVKKPWQLLGFSSNVEHMDGVVSGGKYLIYLESGYSASPILYHFHRTVTRITYHAYDMFEIDSP